MNAAEAMRAMDDRIVGQALEVLREEYEREATAARLIRLCRDASEAREDALWERCAHGYLRRGHCYECHPVGS